MIHIETRMNVECQWFCKLWACMGRDTRHGKAQAGRVSTQSMIVSVAEAAEAMMAICNVG